jgi:hypothetical protein
MKRQYSTCDRCGKVIYYGNAFVSINRYIEQAEFSIARNRVEIQPIDSFQILTLCGACGNLFDVQTISKIIKTLPTDSSETN